MAAAEVTHDIDRYEILAPLGQGGFGAVYLARHRMTGREVALKVSDPQGDPELVARALNEARIAATTRHPSLVDVYDCGSLPDGRIFVAMERVDGRSLESILEREGRLTAERAVIFASQVLSALEVVHARGVIHRDIKPSNLLVRSEPDGSERVFVIDFGISKVTRAGASLAQPATMVGAILGTPGYMPPEQLDARTVDARADLYAVGAVLFRALSGQVLFDAQSLAEWFVAITQAPTPPLASVAPWVPAGICAVVDRAIARDRDARPPTARAMREWLLAAMSGAPAISQPTSTAKLAAVSAQHIASAVVATANSNAHPPPASLSYDATAYANSQHAVPPRASAPSVAPRSQPPYAQPISVAPAQPSPTYGQQRSTHAANNNKAIAIITAAAVCTTAALLAISRPWETEAPDDVSTVTSMAPAHSAAIAATNAMSAQPAPVLAQTPAQAPAIAPQTAQAPAQPQPSQPAPPSQPSQPSQPSSAATATNGLLAALTGAAMPRSRDEQESSDVALLRSPSGRLRFVQARQVGAVDMGEVVDFIRRAMPSIESCHGGERGARASITMMFRPNTSPAFSQPASTGGALARCVEIAIQTANPSMRQGTRSGGILADAEFEWR